MATRRQRERKTRQRAYHAEHPKEYEKRRKAAAARYKIERVRYRELVAARDRIMALGFTMDEVRELATEKLDGS